ncbi:MAG: PorT family protein, partial [Hymenobacter sp.]
HYIDVPVLAHINAGGLFFELGPQIGFLASAKGSQELNGMSVTDDIKDELKTVDFGYAAGLGYQMQHGPGIGLRYNGGFSDLNKDNNNSDYAVRNSAFQLYLTYMFGGK